MKVVLCFISDDGGFLCTWRWFSVSSVMKVVLSVHEGGSLFHPWWSWFSVYMKVVLCFISDEGGSLCTGWRRFRGRRTRCVQQKRLELQENWWMQQTFWRMIMMKTCSSSQYQPSVCLKPGFHYPSWQPELTAQVDGYGPLTRVVETETRARQRGPCWRVMKTGHPSTRVVETGL